MSLLMQSTLSIYTLICIQVTLCGKNKTYNHQVKLFVTLICELDNMLLTTIASNHSALLVYLTFSYIPKVILQRLSKNAVLLLALLPKFPKGHWAAKTQEASHQVFKIIFKPLKVCAISGLNIDCSDGYICKCYQYLIT